MLAASKSPIKILVLSHISELTGGAEKSLLDVFDIWAKKYDIKPEFILRIPVGTLGTALKKRDWKYYELDYTFWSEANPPKDKEAIARKANKNIRAVVEIEKIIKKTKPDMVVTNSVVCPWAALAAYKQKVPHVWFVREYGDLDHGRIYEIGREKTLEDVNNLSNLVITNSEALQKHLAKYIPKNKLAIIYNPFDIKKLKKQSLAKVKNPFKSKESLKLVATGSLTPSKGQLGIAEAVARLNKEGLNTELCLIGGNGPKEYETKIRKISKELGSKIHLVGHQANPLAFVALADVGVMASRMEAFGRVTFEYMAIGKPVIGTNSGGTPEMITPGKNGFLYEPGDINGLVNCLKKYVEDKGLIVAHGKASAEKAESMMSAHMPEELFKKLEAASQISPKNTDVINYMGKLANYEKIAGENQATKAITRKLKAKAGRGYRFVRSTARKIIKERRYAKD